MNLRRSLALALSLIILINPLAASVTLADIHSLFPRAELAQEQVSKDKPIQEIKPLSPEAIKEIYFLLLSQYSDTRNNADETLVDKKFLEKVELAELLKHLNRTTTGIGFVCLADFVAHPTHDLKTLNSRQAIIKLLLENEELFASLQESLKTIALAEPTALTYYLPNIDLLKEETYKRVYFSKRLSFLNTNQYALECSTRAKNLLNGALAIQIPATFAIADGLGQGFATKSVQNGLKATGKKLLNWVNPQQNTFAPYSTEDLAITRNLLIDQFSRDLNGKTFHLETLIISCLPKTLGDSAFLLQHGTNPERLVHSAFLAGAYLWTAYIMKKNYGEFKFDMAIIQNLQQQLIAVATYVNTMRSLYETIKDYPEFAQHADFLALDHLFGNSSKTSKKLQHLITLLNSNTFTGTPSIFSLSGKILAAHTLMNEIKGELTQAYQAIGALDVYLSSAQLMKDHKHTPVHYCFADYEESDNPSVTVSRSWNPFIDPQQAVSNSIQFGNHAPKNSIITGPNTGGKTTTIKSILYDILLGQTLGISPADQVAFTPFKTLNCYLNVTDDLTAGVSLFKAEVLRAKNLVNSVRNLGFNEFSFTIVDEVFSGTSPQEGQEAAYRFIKELGNFENSICLCATHFAKLTELPQENAQFKNYCVTIHKDEHGNWIRPFILEEGASEVNIAMELLEEEGVFESFNKEIVAST